MSGKKLVFKYKDKDYLYRTVLYNKSTRRRSLFVAAIISWKEKVHRSRKRRSLIGWRRLSITAPEMGTHNLSIV